MLQQSLGGMVKIPQWFIWRLTWDAADQKYHKVPCYADGSVYRMNAQDPANWMTFDAADALVSYLRGQQPASSGVTYTLGFMLTASTGYWFLDIDKCVSNGQVSQLANDLGVSFRGAAWEWSSSSSGLHILGRGVIPLHRKKDPFGLHLEFYSDKRGIAFGLTGQMWGDIDTDHSGAVDWLVNNYFPPNPFEGEILDSQFDGPDPGWSGPTDDAELIAMMSRKRRASAAEVFGGEPVERASFADLYAGDPAVMDRIYGNDESGAEFALIGTLAFWTGRDAPRIERLMRQSGLYREKWESGRNGDSFIRYSILRLLRTSYAERRPVLNRSGAPRISDLPQNSHVPSGAPLLGTVAPAVPMAEPAASSTPIVVTIEPGKWECTRHWQSVFNSCGTGEELEQAAREAQVDERMTFDAAFTLGADLHKRFDDLQIKKKIDWCRGLLMPSKVESGGLSAIHAMTEMGNADRMIDRYGKDLMYVIQMDKWYRWNDVRWKYCYDAEMKHYATLTIRALPKEMDDMDTGMQQAFYKFALESQKRAMVSAMISHATANMEVARDASLLDADRNIIGARNGAIDLHTAIALAPNRQHYLTACCGCDYVPHAKAPWFEQTVSECFYGDVEMIAFFKRLMGYTLLADPKEQILIIPFGSGANGKSTVLTAIQKTLGDYAVGVPSETFVSTQANVSGNAGGPREDLLRLRGARYVYISEIEEGAQLKESLVKTLTGGESITARGINAKDSVEFTPLFVPIMPTNHKPTIKGDDEGIWRRIKLIPFTRNFKTDPYIMRDESRSDKLDYEREGILRWLVEGAIEYRTYGLCEPASVRDATAEYRDEMDYMKEWKESYCEFGPEFRETKADLFESWKKFAEPRGLLRYMSSQNQLARKLTGNNVVPIKDVPGKKGRGFRGIRLKSDATRAFSG